MAPEQNAVTVSESTGNVMVFRGGKAILEVENIRLGGAPARGTDLRYEYWSGTPSRSDRPKAMVYYGRL